MRPSQALSKHRSAVREIALRHKVRDVRIYGSVLRGEDTEDSDLDLVVEPTPETTLMDLAAIELEVELLLGVPVDVQTPNSLPAKFRAEVLAGAQPV